MDWAQRLVSGSVEDTRLVRIASLVAASRILRDQLPGRLPLRDAQRRTLAEIGTTLGTHALEDVASIVPPATILAWHRTRVAQQCDGSKHRTARGRPRPCCEAPGRCHRRARGVAVYD